MGFEHRRLVVLHVLGIGERQTFHGDQQGSHRPGDAPRMAAHKLGGIGIAFLGHDRGSGGETVGQFDKTERLARPDHEFFRQPGKVQAALGGRHQIVEREIPVRYRIQAIGGRTVKAQH